MLACIEVTSLSPDADYATFQTSSAALVAALRMNGMCILQLSASDAEIVQNAVVEAKVGFHDGFSTGGTRTAELARFGYKLASHKELFEVRKHGPTLPHPAGAAVQEVSSHLATESSKECASTRHITYSWLNHKTFLSWNALGTLLRRNKQ